MSGLDRKQTLRRDCGTCNGRGYKNSAAGEEMCDQCGGSGMLELEVPYKFDTDGKRTLEEEAQEWGIPVEELRGSRGDTTNED
jgi:DnaJ-class molecular chaperone